MIDFFIQSAWATPEPQQGAGSFVFMIVIFILLMYLLIIRPQMKQTKAHQALIDSLAKGDEVATGGGLLGRVREIGDNFVLLEVASKVEIKVRKQSISQVMPKGSLKGM